MPHIIFQWTQYENTIMILKNLHLSFSYLMVFFFAKQARINKKKTVGIQYKCLISALWEKSCKCQHFIY